MSVAQVREEDIPPAVVKNGRPGIVSLWDLARGARARSPLADLSAAAPDHEDEEGQLGRSIARRTRRSDALNSPVDDPTRPNGRIPTTTARPALRRRHPRRREAERAPPRGPEASLGGPKRDKSTTSSGTATSATARSEVRGRLGPRALHRVGRAIRRCRGRRTPSGAGPEKRSRGPGGRRVMSPRSRGPRADLSRIRRRRQGRSGAGVPHSPNCGRSPSVRAAEVAISSGRALDGRRGTRVRPEQQPHQRFVPPLATPVWAAAQVGSRCDSGPHARELPPTISGGGWRADGDRLAPAHFRLPLRHSIRAWPLGGPLLSGLGRGDRRVCGSTTGTQRQGERRPGQHGDQGSA